MKIISEANSNKVANMAFVASLLVVFIHLSEPSVIGIGVSWCCHYFIRHIIAPIAVPFFFVVSGYFLAAHTDGSAWWVREVGKRINSLCLPFIIWNLLYCGLLCLLCQFENCSDLSWGAAIGLCDGKPALISLWYVRALFMFVLASPMIIWFVRTCSSWGLFFACMLYVFAKVYVDSNYWKTFWEYVIPLGGAFYFMFGVYFFMNPNHVKLSRAFAGGLGAFGIVIGLVGMMCRLYMNGSGQIIARGMRILSIPFVLIGGWSCICPCRWPKWLVRTAFPIYLIHMFVIRVVEVSCNKLGVSYAESLCSTVIVYLIVVAISMIIAVLTQYYCKALAKWLFGGR